VNAPVIEVLIAGVFVVLIAAVVEVLIAALTEVLMEGMLDADSSVHNRRCRDVGRRGQVHGQQLVQARTWA
jgi:hypothetical protein